MKSPTDTEQTANAPAVLQITTVGEDSACYFWSGMFRRGTVQSQELLALSDYQKIFAIAAQQGLHEDEAVMLSNTDCSPSRYTYLVPAPADPQQVERATVQAFVSALKLWRPSRAGLYLAPQLVAPQVAAEMLLQIVRGAMLAASLREFCLATGTAEANELLNTTVWLKENLEKEAINVCIYH